MAWVSPTGHNDPSLDWNNEANAYDENTGNYSQEDFGSQSYLELNHAALNCDKIQVWLTEGMPQSVNAAIDVYYSGAWHNIHSGVVTAGQWVEVAIGSTQSVTSARIKSNVSGYLQIREFDFNEVEAPPTYIPKVIMVQ